MLVSLPARRVAVLLPAAVLVVALALYLWWPAGVLLGTLLGVVTVLAAGAAQQRTARRIEPDEDVESALGFVVPRAAVRAPVPHRAPAPAPRPVVVPPAAAPLRPAVGPDPFIVVEEAGAEQPAASERAASESAPSASEQPAAVQVAPATLRPERMKARLGDDWPDFTRAARLVVETQYASAARLQRDLQLPYARARRLLAGLETEHIVGPATGSLPRQVLLPKERLPEVERLLAGASR